MLSFSLQSGSNGNSIYVEAGDARLLFDAGISGRQMALRLAARGRDPADCDAVIISHEHTDHVCGLRVLQKKYGVPAYLTERTWRAARNRVGPLTDVRRFTAGEAFTIKGVTIHTIRTPHDAVDSVCFVVEHDGKRLGIFSDLGHPFAALRDALNDVDAAYLESNYDPEMLEFGPYPAHLKQRIASDAGHISNQEAAALSRTVARGSRLKWLGLAHLSEQNNAPELALDAQADAVGKSFPVFVASRKAVSEIWEV
ncbi:MAG: MBL fold metallo-hydrolase [Phycisphaerales bacterium]|nr:MBL fold metallo-hydrolase [Phycisphaerales bacterium]